ncbi:hypothetical protein BD413DRAFT_617437 [Trametes elegans]|nr:hypothetical protein BD413DRAFT_617437 [Trametes elegans]
MPKTVRILPVSQNLRILALNGLTFLPSTPLPSLITLQLSEHTLPVLRHLFRFLSGAPNLQVLQLSDIRLPGNEELGLTSMRRSASSFQRSILVNIAFSLLTTIAIRDVRGFDDLQRRASAGYPIRRTITNLYLDPGDAGLNQLCVYDESGAFLRTEQKCLLWEELSTEWAGGTGWTDPEDVWR